MVLESRQPGFPPVQSAIRTPRRRKLPSEQWLQPSTGSLVAGCWTCRRRLVHRLVRVVKEIALGLTMLASAAARWALRHLDHPVVATVILSHVVHQLGSFHLGCFHQAHLFRSSREFLLLAVATVACEKSVQITAAFCLAIESANSLLIRPDTRTIHPEDLVRPVTSYSIGLKLQLFDSSAEHAVSPTIRSLSA
jgi:hypothetical protein